MIKSTRVAIVVQAISTTQAASSSGSRPPEWMIECVRQYATDVPTRKTRWMPGDDAFLVFFSNGNRSYVTKIFPDGSPERVRTEVQFARYLGDCGLPVPEYVPSRSGARVVEIEGGGHMNVCYCMSRMEGNHLARVTQSQAKEIAVFVAKAHQFGQAFQPEASKSLTHLEPLTKAQDQVMKQISEIALTKPEMKSYLELTLERHLALERASQVSRFNLMQFPISGDYRLANLLFVGAHLSAVLDFSDLRYGPCEYDLAVVICNLIIGRGGHSLAQAFWKHYLATKLFASEPDLRNVQFYASFYTLKHGVRMCHAKRGRFPREGMRLISICNWIASPDFLTLFDPALRNAATRLPE